MLPILEKYAAQNFPQVKVVKIDIDDAAAITTKYGIRSVPTMMVFNKGESLGSKVGMSSLADLSNFVMTKTG